MSGLRRRLFLLIPWQTVALLFKNRPGGGDIFGFYSWISRLQLRIFFFANWLIHPSLPPPHPTPRVFFCLSGSEVRVCSDIRVDNGCQGV